jgi:alcohol dehydrogenase
MRAVTIYAHGGNEQLRYESDFPDPKAGDGDVLVRIRAASINYHDIFTRRGMPGIHHEFPWIMGMDFAGDIVERGPNVPAEWQAGDRVLVNPYGRIADGNRHDNGHGGLAELYRARWHQLVHLPAGVSYEEAASLPVAYGTAVRMLLTVGKVRSGETVYILGASGGVGVCAVQLAKLAGATVIAAGSTAEKGRRLLELGADVYINYTEEKIDEAIYKRFGKPSARGRSTEGGVDVVVNYTGSDTWVPSIRALKHGGRLLTCGATAGFDPKEDIRHIWTFERQIIGSNSWGFEDLDLLLAYLTEGKLKVLISKVLPLEQAAEALRIVRGPQSIRQSGGDAMTSPLTKEQLQERLDTAGGQLRLQRLQVRAADRADQEVTLVAPFREEFGRGAEAGRWHGGAIASVIDTAAVFAFVHVTGSGVPTVNIRIDYLKPALGDLTLIGRLRRLGRSVSVADVDVHDTTGALVAIGRATLQTPAN